MTHFIMSLENKVLEALDHSPSVGNPFMYEMINCCNGRPKVHCTLLGNHEISLVHFALVHLVYVTPYCAMCL